MLGKKNDYKWGALSSINELNESREVIQSTLRSLFPMVNDVWSKVIELRGKSYQKAYDLIDTLQIPPGKMIEQGSSQLANENSKQFNRSWWKVEIEWIKKYPRQGEDIFKRLMCSV